MKSKKKIGDQCDPVVAARVKSLRTETLGMDQATFSKVLGVSQAIVSQWENRRYSPTPMALKAMGSLAPQSERQWWFDQAGGHHSRVETLVTNYKKAFEIDAESERTILVYGSAGAGPFRFVPQEAEAKIALPRSWFSPDASLIGLRINGDSMWPLMVTGSIVVIDLGRRQAAELAGRIVAASDGEGVSIKYLRRAGRSYILVPKNLNADNQIVPFTNEHRVLGEVVYHLSDAKLLWD